MTKRLKPAERRASILAVAKILFADSGYHGVSVDEIAKRLAVSPAVLYQHFDSKEQLYIAVLDAIANHRESYIEAVLACPDDFASVLRSMAHVYAASIERDPDYLKMEMHSVLSGSKSTQQLFESRWKSFSDYIEFSMLELAPEGIVNQVNPYSASLMFQGLMREVLYAKCIYFSEKYQDTDLKTLIDQQLELFLRAIDYKQ